MRLIFAAIACSFAWSTPLFAKKELPEQAYRGQVRWGSCRLEPGIQADRGDKSIPEKNKYPLLCIKPEMTSQVALREDKGTENAAYHYGSLYHGLHLDSLVSIHGFYEASRMIYLGAPAGARPTVTDNARTDRLFLQVGNPSKHKFRTSVGKVRPVFGINTHPLPEIYDALLRTQKYWRAPKFGVRMTYDTQVSSVFDISAHTDEIRHEDRGVDANGSDPNRTSVAVRTMFDIAAMDGFRFVVSGYGAASGERRGGAGVVNTSSRGDQTTLEWVRMSDTVNVTSADFHQNFRLNFASAFRSDTRWVFDFESERRGYRMGTIGFDFHLPDYGLFSLAGTLYNGWSKSQDSFVMITSGVKVAL